MFTEGSYFLQKGIPLIGRLKKKEERVKLEAKATADWVSC
jgi:hypothetical protein